LEELANFDVPWVARGDFNAVISGEDKPGGRDWLSSVGNVEFQHFFLRNRLFLVPETDSIFTWSNNHNQNETRIYEKLDRAIYNGEWKMELNIPRRFWQQR